CDRAPHASTDAGALREGRPLQAFRHVGPQSTGQTSSATTQNRSSNPEEGTMSKADAAQTDSFATLLTKIEDGVAVCGVVGLGYVGLPLGVEMARRGFRVLGYDVSQRVVDSLNDGRSHVGDVSDAMLAEACEKGGFEATTDPARLAECD